MTTQPFIKRSLTGFARRGLLALAVADALLGRLLAG